MCSLPVFSNDGGTTLSYPLAPGLNCSRLALGCMNFGGSWEPGSAIDNETRRRARAALEKAIELGWDFFDHADIYCRGRSETLFGELVRELGVERESIIVQDKCGIRFEGDTHPAAPHRFDFSRGHIVRSVEESLQRLQMDYIDILLLHRPDLLAQPEEIMEAFAALHGSGKVAYFGVSNFTPALLDLYREGGFTPVANQVEINLLRTSLLDSTMVSDERLPHAGHPADGTLEWHRRRGVVTQAWAPMAYGYVSGRDPDWDPERVGKAAATVREIADAHGVQGEAVVTAWLLRHPAGIQPVIGSRDPARLEACHQALKLELTREEWYRLYLAGRGKPLP